MKLKINLLMLAWLGLNCSNVSAKLPKELECLTRNVYYESGNQSYKGKLAVALVTLNRVNHPNYPDTICKVVYQPMQFSWTKDSKLLATKVNNQQWFESFLAAKEAMSGSSALGSFSATHFHNIWVDPKWGLKRVAKIGQHIFYK